MSKAAEVIESLKKQLADMSSDEECVWPACILGTDEAQALVDAFTVPEELTTTSDVVREAVKRHVRATAAHIKENADALKQFDWERNEARCRDLCAMYLEEIALTMDMNDRLAETSKRSRMNRERT